MTGTPGGEFGGFVDVVCHCMTDCQDGIAFELNVR